MLASWLPNITTYPDYKTTAMNQTMKAFLQPVIVLAAILRVHVSLLYRLAAAINLQSRNITERGAQ